MLDLWKEFHIANKRGNRDEINRLGTKVSLYYCGLLKEMFVVVVVVVVVG